MGIDLPGESDDWLHRDPDDVPPLRYSEKYSVEERVRGAVENGVLEHGARIAYCLEEDLEF